MTKIVNYYLTVTSAAIPAFPGAIRTWVSARVDLRPTSRRLRHALFLCRSPHRVGLTRSRPIAAAQPAFCARRDVTGVAMRLRLREVVVEATVTYRSPQMPARTHLPSQARHSRPPRTPVLMLDREASRVCPNDAIARGRCRPRSPVTVEVGATSMRIAGAVAGDRARRREQVSRSKQQPDCCADWPTRSRTGSCHDRRPVPSPLILVVQGPRPRRRCGSYLRSSGNSSVRAWKHDW